MSFLKVGVLWALPLVLMPLVIHWLYRRRHQTVAWPAMIFLRRANLHRSSPAKWRRRLILATRVAIVAALILALARPLSTGRFGIAASRLGDRSTAIVLLDRSPDMQFQLPSGKTRQHAALESVAATLETLGQTDIVVIDSVNAEPQFLQSSAALLGDSLQRPADSEADLPLLFDRALSYLSETKTTAADIWVCSTRQTRSWRPDASAWRAISKSLATLRKDIKLYRLDFPAPESVNLAVSVSEVRYVNAEQGRGVQFTITVRSDRSERTEAVPVQITLGNVTETVEVPLVGGQGELVDHFVAIPDDLQFGYGVVSIPTDINPADDRWFFVAKQSDRSRFAIRTEQRSDALAAAAEVQGKIVHEQSLDSPQRVGKTPTASWIENQPTCLLWQGALPDEPNASQIRSFVEAGGNAVFFPPAETTPESNAFAGLRWQPWVRQVDTRAEYDGYRFSLERYCPVAGQAVVRATVAEQQTLIGKRRLGKGNVWFCGADVLHEDGRFVQDGVALFALLNEAATASRTASGDDGSWQAGQVTSREGFSQAWNSAWSSALMRDSDGPVRWSEFGHHAGVFELKSGRDSEGRLRAINRVDVPPGQQNELPDDAITSCLPQADWHRVSIAGTPGTIADGFAREIWFAVWTLLITGLLLEALLSLPRSGDQT